MVMNREKRSLEISKGKSPFYPGQPVPVELFVGRRTQLERIRTRGVEQVAAGKPVAIYIQGEYGIGKSSIAGYVQWLAERQYGLHVIYAPLGSAETMDAVGAAVLEATVRSGALNPKRSEKIRDWLAKYIGEQSFWGGFTLHGEALERDAPTIASGMLPFLTQVFQRLKETGVRGILLTMDEINGVTANPKFAHFIKGLVDSNAMSRAPLPLLLMLCGVEERRREMIRHHQPVDRIFDVLEVGAMSEGEMAEFFSRAFDSVQMRVEDDAMQAMIHWSAGFPKIMHLVGDAAYWIDKDGIVDGKDAIEAVLAAADDVGKKYVEQQVYKALRSTDYHSILRKIAQTGLNMNFQRSEVAKGLTEAERRKLDNFLRKMRKLNVIRPGDIQGEYVFNVRMVRFYIWLQSLESAT